MSDTKLNGLIAAREIAESLKDNDIHISFNVGLTRCVEALDAAIAAERKRGDAVDKVEEIAQFLWGCHPKADYRCLWGEIAANGEPEGAKIKVAYRQVAIEALEKLERLVPLTPPNQPHGCPTDGAVDVGDNRAEPVAMTSEAARALADDILRDVCDLEYTSPDSQPDLLQVTTGELTAILENRVAALRARRDDGAFAEGVERIIHENTDAYGDIFAKAETLIEAIRTITPAAKGDAG
jgi:hypothetical protein